MEANFPAAPTNTPFQPTPLARTVSAADYQAQKEAETAAKTATLAAPEQSSALLSYLQTCKNEAVDAKQTAGITDRLLDAQRRRKGEHSPTKKAQLALYKMPDYWVPLTQTKCIHTEAWLRDLLMPYADKIWLLEPTVIPELPDDQTQAIIQEVAQEIRVAQGEGIEMPPDGIRDVHDAALDAEEKKILEEAKERAKAMERLIQDQHEECDFRAIFREAQSNLVTYGTAFIKGPYTVRKKMPKWDGNQRVVVDKVIPSCSAPSPHDIFPAPWAKNEQEGYIIERIKTYREGLNEVKTLKYYVTKEIEALLTERTSRGNTILYGEDVRAIREDKSLSPPDDRFELWQFTGPIPGYMLTEWNVEGCVDTDDYLMEVLWSGNHILKVMPMWDEVGIRPYFRAVFKPVVGSFWGVGVPHLMSASQDRANMLMIAMIDNASWASGATGWVELDRLVNADDYKTFHPKKIIAVQSRPGQSGAPMGFLDIALRVPELNALYQGCLSDADNESGVPAYMYGSGSAGAGGGTFSGLTTLMNAAARGIKDALLEVDTMISRLVQHWADWNNQYHDKPEIKGDVRVVCSGATGLFVHELQLSRLDDMLNQAVSLAPVIGPRLAIALLRQKGKGLKVDLSGLPSDEELKEKPPAPIDAQSSAASPGESTKSLLPANTQPGARPEAPEPIASLPQAQ